MEVKDDIKKIDFIIKELIRHGSRVDSNDLHTVGIYEENQDHGEIENDFLRVLRFMYKNKMCDAIFDSDNVCAMPNENIYDVKELGVIKYLEEMKKQNKNKTITKNTINVSGDNKGNISQSLKRDFNSPTTQIIKKRIDKDPSKKSVIEIGSWILGAIASLILIYEFIIKSLLTKT